jgi:hypothetical protein
MTNPKVDELAMMTYISYFRDWEAKNAGKKKNTAGKLTFHQYL